MTAARPAIGSPCRSSGGRAVALQQTPRRSASKLQCNLRSTRTFVRGRLLNAAERASATYQIKRVAGDTASPVRQLPGSADAANGFCLAVGLLPPFPGNGARGPGVAASKSTAAAPVFNFAHDLGIQEAVGWMVPV